MADQLQNTYGIDVSGTNGSSLETKMLESLIVRSHYEFVSNCIHTVIVVISVFIVLYISIMLRRLNHLMEYSSPVFLQQPELPYHKHRYLEQLKREQQLPITPPPVYEPTTTATTMTVVEDRLSNI